jgi:hypothetical protein
MGGEGMRGEEKFLIIYMFGSKEERGGEGRNFNGGEGRYFN